MILQKTAKCFVDFAVEFYFGQTWQKLLDDSNRGQQW